MLEFEMKIIDFNPFFSLEFKLKLLQNTSSGIEPE